MKAGEFRNQTDEELKITIRDLRRDLFSLKYQLATGQLEKVDRLSATRRDIARALTILQERRRETGAVEGEQA